MEKITIVKNCVRRTENTTTSNVKVANRVTSKGKTESIKLYPIPGYDGYYADIKRGIVYGRLGHPIGYNNTRGRIKIGINIDGKHKNLLRSRLIMSAALGRELVSGEEVDHVNNITTDDRISNLNLCDHKSNMNNSLTRTLQSNKVRRRNKSEKIVLTGTETVVTAAAAPKRTYKIEKAK